MKRIRPPAVAAIVEDVCSSCDAPCAAYLKRAIDFTDADAQCPRAWPRRWGCYGECGSPAAAPKTPPAPTSLIKKMGRFLTAMMRWARAGFGLTERRHRALRKAACEACEHWRPKAHAGLGECRHPACGCTKLKRWLPTETCPAGRWPI